MFVCFLLSFFTLCDLNYYHYLSVRYFIIICAVFFLLMLAARVGEIKFIYICIGCCLLLAVYRLAFLFTEQ